MPDYYKLLNLDGTTPQGYGKWPLPRDGKPGEWLPTIKGKLAPCENGYHAMELGDLLDWEGPLLVRVEVGGEIIRDGNKSVCRRARTVSAVDTWNERNLRLLAADCAERVLHIYEKEVPGDLRPREAITAARAFANGEITREQLAAARAAAWDAAWAAWAAARADAEAAAWDAAWAAAQAAEAAARAARAWATGAVTRVAARAASAATEDASAAWAAWAAAEDAERKWQNEQLAQYLSGEDF